MASLWLLVPTFPSHASRAAAGGVAGESGWRGGVVRRGGEATVAECSAARGGEARWGCEVVGMARRGGQASVARAEVARRGGRCVDEKTSVSDAIIDCDVLMGFWTEGRDELILRGNWARAGICKRKHYSEEFAVNISNAWVLPQEGFPVFYRYFRDRITWFEADAVCQFHHANLVTVDNSVQFDTTRAYLKELDVVNNVWIGLKKGGPNEQFAWTTILFIFF
ncbi:Putative agglucetin1 [Gryllus bimaculatus]|nr:Putative agglucetin1 [Gryllus bimaculatus]